MDHETFTPKVEQRQRESGFLLSEQPIVRSVVDGTLDRDQLREWTKQFFVTVTRILRIAHSRPKLPAHLFDAEMKRYMWENRVEEEFGALSGTAGHIELMLRFAEAQGLSRLDMAEAKPSAETAHLLEFVEQICRDESVVNSQIMLGFVEAMMPDACERFTEGLQANYGMSPDETRFFSVHVYADEEHGDIAKRMVALVPENELEHLADVVLEYTQRFVQMWAGPVLAHSAA